MKRRALFVVGAAAITSFAAALSCSSFDASPGGTSGTDAGDMPEAAAIPADGSPGRPDAATGPADSGSCTETCNSRRCDVDGGCYPLVFVTEEKFAGDLDAPGLDGGIHVGDDICSAEAADAGKGGVYKAFLSSTVEDALERVTRTSGSNRPAVDAMGTTLATSYAAMATEPPDGGLLAPLARTASGSVVSTDERVWTGTFITGAAFPEGVCRDWTTPNDMAGAGHFGQVGHVDKLWVDSTNEGCSNKHRLYCFEIVP